MDQPSYVNRPVLIADLADREAFDVLRSVASYEGVAIVPLLVPPVDRSEHILEAYEPSSSEPLRLLAEPTGGAVKGGFPLRLRDLEAGRRRERRPHSSAPPIVRGTQPDIPSLTERHTRDLEPVDAREDNPAALVGRTLGGRFRLEACLGRGGMGAVFRARHTAIGIPVAVKILKSSLQQDPAFAARFHAEALAMSRLSHANIARILDYGQEPDGLLFLVMELVEGMTLQDLLDTRAAFDEERIATIMMQVCAGLGHAHAQGLVHRDVKPSNVILASVRDDDDRSHELAKVCDFGIAFDAVAAEGTYGALVGTPEYMSPELTRGDEVDARSDVYAVGVVLYELATGSVPFEDAKAERLFAMHRRAPPPSPRAAVPNLDPRLEAIILKALAKAPADRQQSMRELREELRALLAGDPSSAPAGRKPAVRAEGAWLEDSKQMYETFMMTAADEPVDLPGLTVARSLVTNADRWLAEFAAITDPQIAAREARGLEAALDILVEQDARSVLARVVVALRAAAGDAMPGLGTCAEIAARTLRAMEDPERLGAIARHALEGDGELDPDTLRLFVETRAAGAHALVAARATHDAPSARARFIAAMRAVRDPALPVILGELKRAFDAGDLATSEIEDLLRAVPPVADEAAGAIVAAFLRSPRAEVAAAALAATVRLWGHRARPLLIGAAENTPSAVRSVAVSGLRALGAVDAHAVRLLARVLSDRTSSLDARTSAAEALGVSQADARSAAGLVLERVLGETVAGTRIAAADPEAQRYVLALARSLLAVGGPSGVGLIRRCAGAPELPEQLREKLHTLVRAAPQK